MQKLKISSLTIVSIEPKFDCAPDHVIRRRERLVEMFRVLNLIAPCDSFKDAYNQFAQCFKRTETTAWQHNYRILCPKDWDENDFDKEIEIMSNYQPVETLDGHKDILCALHEKHILLISGKGAIAVYHRRKDFEFSGDTGKYIFTKPELYKADSRGRDVFGYHIHKSVFVLPRKKVIEFA